MPTISVPRSAAVRACAGPSNPLPVTLAVQPCMQQHHVHLVLQYLNGRWDESIGGPKFPPMGNYSKAWIKVSCPCGHPPALWPCLGTAAVCCNSCVRCLPWAALRPSASCCATLGDAKRANTQACTLPNLACIPHFVVAARQFLEEESGHKYDDIEGPQPEGWQPPPNETFIMAPQWLIGVGAGLAQPACQSPDLGAELAALRLVGSTGGTTLHLCALLRGPAAGLLPEWAWLSPAVSKASLA
jgi:hypothetical protein